MILDPDVLLRRSAGTRWTFVVITLVAGIVALGMAIVGRLRTDPTRLGKVQAAILGIGGLGLIGLGLYRAMSKGARTPPPPPTAEDFAGLATGLFLFGVLGLITKNRNGAVTFFVGSGWAAWRAYTVHRQSTPDRDIQRDT